VSAAIYFTPDGTGHALHTDAIDLAAVGRLAVVRATSIEFDNAEQCWRVRDGSWFPLFRSPSRQECLDWERRHLEAREDARHAAAVC